MTPNELEIVRTTWNQFEIVLAGEKVVSHEPSGVRRYCRLLIMNARRESRQKPDVKIFGERSTGGQTRQCCGKRGGHIPPN